jgi:SAM-dependent methyltransferase
MNRICTLISDPKLISKVDGVWCQLSKDFDVAYSSMSTKYMDRQELSFHPYIKLLGFLCLEVAPLLGDIVEIGVWKGKSLALTQRLTRPPTKVIGIDPCELRGQRDELRYFHRTVFPESQIIEGYSHLSIEKVLDISNKFKLLHIDGGHSSENVWMDFLMYERFVVPGGYIVFDDYVDPDCSPEVGRTVDKMRHLGIFKDYYEVGQVLGYESSFVLYKPRQAVMGLVARFIATARGG